MSSIIETEFDESFRGKVRGGALRGVDLKVESGDFLAAFGPAGSGKSTLLNLMVR